MWHLHELAPDTRSRRVVQRMCVALSARLTPSNLPTLRSSLRRDTRLIFLACSGFLGMLDHRGSHGTAKRLIRAGSKATLTDNDGIPMPRKPKSPPDDPEQFKRFIDMAREVEVDESPEAFDRAFNKVIRRQKPPAPLPKTRPT